MLDKIFHLFVFRSLVQVNIYLPAAAESLEGPSEPSQPVPVSGTVMARVVPILDRISSDLRFIWTEREIPDADQEQLGNNGFTTLGLFQAAADDRAGIRAFGISLYGNPAEANLGNDEKVQRTVKIARLVDSWQTAHSRVEEVTRVAAEQVASRMPRTISRANMISLRQRYETDFGRVLDRTFPCQSLVERRLEEVEEGEVKADPLSEVASVEETIQEDLMGAQLQKDGTFRFRRTAKSVSLPADSETLRLRVRMLGITFHLASYKHATRAWLRNSCPQIWLDHLEFILGDDIARFRHQVLDRIITPPWNIVLNYEYQVRKEACRRIMFEGDSLEEAMKKARRCPEVKERHFSTPTAMAAAVSRPAQQVGNKRAFEELSGGKGSKGSKGSKGEGGKGGGKDAGKGDKKPAVKVLHNKTPDGRNLCFRFQSNKCNSNKCHFVHVCSTCLAAGHGAISCSNSAAAK